MEQIPCAKTPLTAKPSENVSVPSYDSNELSTGILHFGVGNFARGHQMSYMEDLLAVDFDNAKTWAYTGVGVREASGKRHQQELGTQGFRYSIVQSDGSGEQQKVQVVGALRDILVGPTAPGEIVRRISCKQTRIVSLTITENGYNTPLSDQDDLLMKLADSAASDASAFAEADANPGQYNGATYMGYIFAGLKARRALGNAGITLMSCDNIPHNGNHMKSKVLSMLEDIDQSLKEWVEDNCTFPNSMVDSITPKTSQKLKDELECRFGIADNDPVPREFFKQWVIEDSFAAGRPAWEKVGVQIVKVLLASLWQMVNVCDQSFWDVENLFSHRAVFEQDVTPYELTKLRMLNVSHTVMGMSGMLKGLENTAEAASDEHVGHLYRSIIAHEILPVLELKTDVTNNIDLDEYQSTLKHRFVNGLVDTLPRIAQDTSEKLRVQTVPAIIEGLDANLEMNGLALTVAAWGHYINKISDDQETLEDPRADAVMQAMKDGGIEKLLETEEMFQQLTGNKTWCQTVVSAYNDVEKEGIEKAITNIYPLQNCSQEYSPAAKSA